MTLLDDWIAYVADPGLFDPSHFEALMLELDTPSKLNSAFRDLPNGFDFVKRLVWFRENSELNGTYLLPLEGSPQKDRMIYAERYRDSVSDRLREMGECGEAGIISSAPVEEMLYDEYKSKKLARSLPFLNAPMAIDFDVSDWYNRFPEWIFGLDEAVLMMTTYPAVTRYLMWPITKYPLDDESYAKLWLMGNSMDFCEDKTLLIIGGAG